MKTEKMLVFSLTLMLVIGSMAFVVVGIDIGRETGLREEGTGNGTRDPVMIYDVHDLQNMSLDMNGNYALANHIDASETSTWNDGAGFASVGTGTNQFTGTLNGNGYEIRDLYINRPDELYVGLFGWVAGGTIENLKVTGSVSGNGWVGGLVGYSDAGPLTIQEVVMEVDVANVNTYTIERVGGLVGVLHNGNRIRNCTSHGSVDGPAGTNMGGLVGRIHSADVIVENSYSTGLVNGGVPGDDVGGLAGFKHADAQVISSYWDTVTSGQGVSAGGEGKATAEMMSQSTFVGWNFAIPGTWVMAGYPRLQLEHTTGITTVEELQLMKLDLTADYTLLNDIDASSTTMWNGGAGFEPVGTEPNPFVGSLEGQEHTISGFFMSRGASNSIGLFGRTSVDGTISNVRLSDVYVSGNEHVGALVGWCNGPIVNSHSSGEVYGTWNTGGLVGVKEGSTISRSSSSATISGVQRPAGLVGWNSGTIEYSYSIGDVSGRQHAGGFLGINKDGILYDCYSTGTVTRDSGTDTYLGGFIGRNDGGSITNCYSIGSVHYEGAEDPVDNGFAGFIDGYEEMSGNYWDVETSGQTGTAGNATGLPTSEMKTQDTFVGWDFEDMWWMIEGVTYPLHIWDRGQGTPENPYWIFDVNDLQDMDQDLSAHYALANDIDASETAGWNDGAGFVPIGTDAARFTGSLDGNNHTISGLYINRTTANVGLFGYIDDDGEISNVRLTDADITSTNGFVGALAGYTWGSITNAHSSGTVVGQRMVGGLVGILRVRTLTHSHSTCHVTATGDWNAGGLAGSNLGHISNSYATGDVTGDGNCGGLVGYNEGGTIEDSYAWGDVTGNQRVGGFVGRNSGTINNAYSIGESIGNTLVGGLVGWNDAGTVEDSFWDVDTSDITESDGGEGKTTGEMMTQSTFIGWDFAIPGAWAMAGYPHLQWEHTTEITRLAELQLMGLDLNADYTLLNDIDASSTTLWNGGAGFDPIGTSSNRFWGSFDGNNHTISGLYIDRTTANLGLFGYIGASGELRNVRLTDADITSTAGYVGPLAGYSWGSITNAHSSGTVVGLTRVGGLVGIHRVGSLTYSHSSSSVTATGEWNVGGLAGSNLGYLSNSYATGTVTGDVNCGGLVGYNEGGTIEDSYAWGDVTGNERVGGLVGRNTGTIDNAYSIGEPTGSDMVGGLVGWNDGGTVDNSFWDTDTSDIHTSQGGTGLPTDDMKTQDTFVGWDFDDIWWMVEHLTYPLFTWQDGDGTPGNPYRIYDVHDLQAMNEDLGAHYILMNHIDASETILWNGGDGFEPVGTEADPFAGSLEGQGLTISELYISRGALNRVGLFGSTGVDGTISNVRLSDVYVLGHHHVGALVGWCNGPVVNSHSSGEVHGVWNTGGLVGTNEGSTISRSSSTATISGDQRPGGLVGWNSGTIEYSYATGDVSGLQHAGGFLGLNNNGFVNNCYSTGTVTRTFGWDTYFGGFVGRNAFGSVTNCYSTGSVHYEDAEDPVDKGFTGFIDLGGDYEMIGNYWDMQTSGQTGTDGNATGLPTAEMKTQDTFVGWDFDDTWHMMEGFTYPLLQWQPLPDPVPFDVELYLTADNGGWNLVSFNLVLEDTDLETILQDIHGSYDRVMWYDASEERWFSHVPGREAHYNNLDTWDHTMGVWIRVTEDVTLVVHGYQPVETAIVLHPGWNMVGLPSGAAGNHDLPAEVTWIGHFDPSQQNNVAYTDDVATFEFQPGQGYWVYNDADHSVTWTVTY